MKGFALQGSFVTSQFGVKKPIRRAVMSWKTLLAAVARL